MPPPCTVQIVVFIWEPCNIQGILLFYSAYSAKLRTWVLFKESRQKYQNYGFLIFIFQAFEISNANLKLTTDDWRILSLFPRLIMWVSFEIKRSKLASSDLICSKFQLSRQLHFLRDVQFVSRILHSRK